MTISMYSDINKAALIPVIVRMLFNRQDASRGQNLEQRAERVHVLTRVETSTENLTLSTPFSFQPTSPAYLRKSIRLPSLCQYGFR